MLAGMVFGSMVGCNLVLPEISHQPVVHNPFPQLSKVAIVPFFNQSDEPTVDGREFALAYFTELQSVPGFEVVPLGVVEEAIIDEHIDLSTPADVRRLAQVLDVDAVIVGAVTDFSPYYPPRCGLRVEWYARNPGFHEIPAGYGLPWGTPDEEFIPAPLVFEAELALAKEQLATQTPNCPPPAPIQACTTQRKRAAVVADAASRQWGHHDAGQRQRARCTAITQRFRRGCDPQTQTQASGLRASGRRYRRSNARASARYAGQFCCERHDRRDRCRRRVTTELARRTRFHPAAAEPGAAAVHAERRSDYDAHANLRGK